MTAQPLQAEQLHLAQLLEAVQRCCFHMHSSARKLPWPFSGALLHARRKDTDLFEIMAAFNERFAKLQDTLGAAHDDDTDYAVIAEHFNQLDALRPAMLATASQLIGVCANHLGIEPASDDFRAEFQGVLSEAGVV